MLSKTFQKLTPRLFRQTLQANFNIFAQKQTLIIANFPKFPIYIANHAMATKRFHSCYLRTFANQNDPSLNTSVDLKSEEDKSQNERPVDISGTEEGMRFSKIMFTRFLEETWAEEKRPRKDFDEVFGKNAKKNGILKALNLINAKQIADVWIDDIFWIGFVIEGEFVLMKDDGYISQTIIYCSDPKIFDKLKTVLAKMK